MSVTNAASSEAGPIRVHYEAGFIVLSYIISVIGCTSTLELLHRRTSIRGAFNWYLLIASSITMGGIGIWSMHFVGNRAIVLADGAANLQLEYDKGFTALSFFLPIAVLVMAFYFLGVSGKATQLNILVASLLTGTAICAMHYVGQVGITNYDCTYKIGNIVGAAIIAVVASLVALVVFFRLRENWTDSWWKRCSCAALLAGSVSGMHWTATVGTIYNIREEGMNRGGQSRVQTVIVCAVLSFASCVVLLAIAFIKRRRSIVQRRRAQEVVLACAYFDEHDRVMVSNDGFLPYQKIANQYVRKTFGDDELNRSHPAFVWVYEATRNWSVLRGLIPSVQKQLATDPMAKRYQPENEESINFSRTASADFELIFKQLFCVAADKLANQIHERIEKLGVLFEEPLETGTTKSGRAFHDRLAGLKHMDVEKNPVPKLFGKGRHLFLNRRLDKTQAANFAAHGYRFASIFHVAESLARNMQVSHESMLSRLERMKVCISREHLLPAGIHLACFFLRPSIHAGFDVLVPSLSQNQLPLVSLPISTMSSAVSELLNSVDEWTVGDILSGLLPEEKTLGREEDAKWQVHGAFARLVDTVKDRETVISARFSAKPVQAPCRNAEGATTLSTCTLFSIRYLGTIHSSYSDKELTYVPLGFFGAQQVLEVSESRHEVFRRNVQQEFGDLFEVAKRRTQSETGLEFERSLGKTDSLRVISRLSKRYSQNVLDKLGHITPKRSRPQSKSIVSLGQQSGRSSAEPDSNYTTSVKRKTTNTSAEEVHQTELTETPYLVSTKHDEITPVRVSNEMELNGMTEVRGTFVSELFGLFQLSNALEKGRLRPGG